MPTIATRSGTPLCAIAPLAGGFRFHGLRAQGTEAMTGGPYFVVSLSSCHAALPVKFHVTSPWGMVTTTSVSVLVSIKSPWPETLFNLLVPPRTLGSCVITVQGVVSCQVDRFSYADLLDDNICLVWLERDLNS